MKLVDGDQPVVKSRDAHLFHRKAEGGMCADQHLVAAGQELTHRSHLGLGRTGLVTTWRVAQVPLRRHLPVPVEAEACQGFVGKAATDGPFGHHHDGLLQALVVQLVQRNEHQRTGLARSRWRLDQQVLLTALGVGALLHGTHAQLVGLAGCAGACGGDGHRGHGVGVGRVAGVVAHDVFFLPLAALAAGVAFSVAVILV